MNIIDNLNRMIENAKRHQKELDKKIDEITTEGRRLESNLSENQAQSGTLPLLNQ